jgi:hypothetical protein
MTMAVRARRDDARCQRRRGGDEHRDVRPEQHQRAEDEDEGGRHDRPIGRGRRLHPQARGEHRREHEGRQFERAVRRHPAGKAREDDRADEDGCECREARSGRKGWHSGVPGRDTPTREEESKGDTTAACGS